MSNQGFQQTPECLTLAIALFLQSKDTHTHTHTHTLKGWINYIKIFNCKIVMLYINFLFFYGIIISFPLSFLTKRKKKRYVSKMALCVYILDQRNIHNRVNPACLSVRLSACLLTKLFVCLSACLSVLLLIILSVCLTAYLSHYPSVTCFYNARDR